MLDLPQYTLLEPAFEGSETILYRGRRDADGARVAVKLTRNEFPTARELARLRREFAILEHVRALPGVVRGYALEKCGRGLALVMEDLGARSLHDLLETQRLDVVAALRIASALADTLQQLHQLRVIHKDIKPHNIMLDPQTLAPRLVDFGIAARLLQETQKAASPGALEGTLAYISPEQTGRSNRPVDRRSDLYSLGATLYEMLIGQPPFATTDPTELIHSHLARMPTPPHERDKAVPRAVSDIVMKLLAKAPEERYQSARGLGADLSRCLAQWQATARIDPFPLGQDDMPLELCIPQKLYGRQAEALALLAAFERARKGAAELILIAGYSGVGKSALVNEIHKPVAQQGGYFTRGKFDQINRDIPLAPIARAFGELLRQILTEPADALAAWKTRLLEAVGQSGRLLFELIPELELVLGPQPEVPALGPNEAKNRFGRLVQRFVRAFCTADHPLALFLDDLQWADPASLRLLSVLLGDVDSRHLLVIGAYRDNEVDVAHPLMSTLDELRKAGAAVSLLSLQPLDLPTVTQLIADTLAAPLPSVEPLAALVFDKTGGNPFFLGQFLRALHDEDLLRLDLGARRWTWDLDRIRAAGVTDNVVELMLGKLQRLSPATQRALQLAACIGHEFDLRTLSTIDERPPAETAAELWQALDEGLVLPLDGDYRLLDTSASAGAASGAELHVTYRFLHDRVLQAAYALIASEHKAEIHHRIGLLLWAHRGEAIREDELLETVRHLNLGRQLIDQARRQDVARLNLRAGRKAKTATAYQAAAGYFSAGVELLGDAGWEQAYELCFALHLEHAECVYLSGAFDQAEALFEALLRRARSALERARIHDLRVILHMTFGKFVEAVSAGREGLRLLGLTLPDTESEQRAAFKAELAKAALLVGDRRIEDLVHAPAIADPERRMLAQLLSDLSLPFYYVIPPLYGVSVLEHVNLCLEHGHTDRSPLAYMSYGFMLATLLGQYERGHAFGKLALALNDRLQNAALTCRLYQTFSAYLYVREPVRAAMPYVEKGREAALETGNFIFFASIYYGGLHLKLGAGFQLDELRDDVDKGLVLARRNKDLMGTAMMTVLRQVIASLQGRTQGRGCLSDDAFEEDAFVATLDPKDHAVPLFNYWALKLQLLYLHGDHAGALAASEQAERLSASTMGMYYTAELSFYTCLTLLALSSSTVTPEEEARRKDLMARHLARIAGLAESSPANFQHKRILIEAEEARVAARHLEALDRYDQAIALARKNEFPQDEALANELCARAYLRLGRAKAAGNYLIDAHLGYLHWGAQALAEDLAREHAPLLLALGVGRRRSGTTSMSATTTSGTTLLSHTMASSLHDAVLVVRATQAIVSELDLPTVIERLVKLVLENADARRGALLLEREGTLFVEATFEAAPERIELGPGAALETRTDLAHKVVLLVLRMRQPVVLDDAGADGRFAADPYVAATAVKSILCLPLIHQGRLSGVMYLENAAKAGAFDAVRVELIGLLSSQAAIAIENARLLTSVRTANERVQRANEHLEAEVAQRTEELRRSNHELSTANQRLQVELAQREQAERERAALQAQMIEAQRERLAELSTPLIPITHGIMVLPLIGSVDAERATQVLEAALQGAQRHRARVVILDVTGIKQIDAQVIGTLLRTASALRLLGTQAVLTGIRAEVAQAMVRLGMDMRGLVTMGTLQSGIAFALGRTGESRQLLAQG